MMTETLISIQDCKLDHLIEGEILPINSGTLSILIPSTSNFTSTTSASDNVDGFKVQESNNSSFILSLDSSIGKVVEQPSFELIITSLNLITSIPSQQGSTEGVHYLVSMPSTSGLSGDSGKAGKGSTEEVEELGFLRITLPITISDLERETFELILNSLLPQHHQQSTTSNNSASVSTGLSDTTTKSIEEDSNLRKKLVLIDEESGDLLGELIDDQDLIIEELPVEEREEGEEEVKVVNEAVSTPAWTPTSNPTSSTIITLSDYLSYGIYSSAHLLASGISKSSTQFVKHTKPTENPILFSEGTKKNVEGLNELTGMGRNVSGKIVGVVGDVMGGIGGKVGGVLGIQSKPNGEIPRGFKGLVHNTLVSLNTITDSLETGGKVLIEASTEASSNIFQHKLGNDSAILVRKVGGSFKHVALVYIDARGITRKALLKTVGKSAIKAKMKDGREIILVEPPMSEEKNLDLVGRGNTQITTTKEKEKGI